MSSEDKSLDPSDQGPSPPVSSAGATPSGSPAPSDKRPRGRPRKDADSVTSKSKKKYGSRCRAQADDNDSMDATDVTSTQDTDITPDFDVAELENDDDFADLLDFSPRDERPLSPLFQRSMSEDSAGSSASTNRKTKTREKLCAFCYCGEKSLLGQGELKLFGPTPGYVPLHIRNRRGSSEKDDDYHDDDNDLDDNDNNRSPGHRGSGLKKVSSPDSGLHSTSAPGSTDPAAEELSRKFWDELGQIGLPDDINVESLFDPTGQCCSHLRCAAWSEGVCHGEGQSLLYVDKAIDSGSTECCAYCKRLGASIKCCEESCGRSYHYPCAAAAGTFQDIKRYTLLCPDHIQQALVRSKDVAKCVACDNAGDVLDQLFCCTCGQHYHGTCLDITVTPLKRAGWQCPECKVCLTCKNPGDDSQMLVCDMCDKCYHTFCLQPVMDSIPTNGWRCKNCRSCAQCGLRSSGQWSSNGLLCEGCQQQQNSALLCLICGRSQDTDGPTDTNSCSTCKRWVHVNCERQEGGDPDAQVQDGYTCSVCKQVEEETQHNKPVSRQEALLTKSEPVEDVFMAVKEVNETKEEVTLEPEATASLLPSVPEEFLSSAEPAQEIQVTVTLTEGPESPPCCSTLVGVPTLSFQASTTTEDHNDEHSLIDGLEMRKETVDILPKPTEDKPKADISKALPDLPTKETSPKLSPAQEKEPMNVCPSDPPGIKDKVAANVPKAPNVVEDIEQGQKQDQQEDEEEALEEPELTCVLHEPEGVPLVPECSPTVDMDTTPASDHSLSGFCSPIEDKGLILKHSPGLSSEGSTKLTQSPFSTEGSPRETSQSQTPTYGLNPAGYSPSVSNTTFISLTPKIGMGKPAILKRKFSPGRPRVKQGAWSYRSAVSLPSWSPERMDAWDSPKTRPLHGLPIWTVRLGRGSGFPGRRRPRGANLSGRGGRGRSRLKMESSPVVTPGVSIMETPYVVKEEEENSMHNTVVMFSTSDSFTLKQDMCVVCGSFGLGAEGRLLACSQCGQCYHPFCVNIKITKVVLSKGWRCLECTVCEACGQATDPGRLLLCDDCDISYHTYCLDPPLQNVPKESWKCKWCVLCTQCGSTSPGLRCEWQNNYTQCGPCASLAVCPVCARSYREEELILQCQQCDRWVHAICQGLNSEEEVENAADDGFDCSLCRLHPMSTPVGTVAQLTDISEPPLVAKILTKVKENDFQRTYTQDGVCLTESGLCQLQSLCVQTARRRRPKPKLKLKIINQNSVAVLQTPPDPQTELFRDGDMDDSREGDLMDCDVKSDSSPERKPSDDHLKGADGSDSNKKRKRKPYRPGIGGFMVRQRSKAGQGKGKRSLSRKDSTSSLTENFMGKQEGWNEPDTLVDETPLTEPLEKVKKRYRKKKTKLEEAFPSYLQEAFFGKELLDKSKQNNPALETRLVEGEARHTDDKSQSSSFLDLLSDPLLSATANPVPPKAGPLPNVEDPLVELVLHSDDDLLGMLSDDLGKPGTDSGLDLCPFQVDSYPSPFAGLDIGTIPDGQSAAPHPSSAQGSRPLQEEPLDVILSPELDKMVSDGAILSKLYKIPELEGKDVEDLFTAVLSPSASQAPQLPYPNNTAPSAPATAMPLQNRGNGGMFPRMPMMNGMMGPNTHFPPIPMLPGAGVSGSFSPIHRMPFPENEREKEFSQLGGDLMGPWTSPGSMPGSVPPPEAETDTMSNAQRSTLKWEKEETLGEMATVAPVLYTNMNFPNLLDEFPDWSTRVKQIAKLWRKASSQERAPYVQKARDNRAALRINKVQLSNNTMKRQQQQQPADPFDPSIPMDAELLFRDPLRHKESEHEQEWKFRQQMRQKSKQQAKIEATQKLEQVKSEQQQLQKQQQQQFSGQSVEDSPNSGNQSPVTTEISCGGNASPLQALTPKDGFAMAQIPGTPLSGASTDDVFLRPQLPLPSTTAKTPTQDTQYPQGTSSQPQSPQMFSPESSGSRPSSPWDPYGKMLGTPQPPTSGSSTPRRGSVSDMQERSRPSPAHESFGSPTSASNDPYAKPPDTPRPSDPFVKPMGPPRPGPVSEQHQQQQGRYLISNVIPGDKFSRPGQRSEAYQRMAHSRMVLSDPYSRPLLTPIPGSNESGSVPVFKTPMPPSHSQQDSFNAAQLGMRRGSSDTFSSVQQFDPFAHQPLAFHPSMGDGFSNESRMMRPPHGSPFAQQLPMSRHPQRDPYSQAPATQRPEFPQQMPDPYAQMPGTPRPHDPYAQMPGTPRPHSDPYPMPPSTPRTAAVDQFPQSQSNSRRQSPSYALDPYAQMPGTPRPSPGERYPKSPGSQRTPDPYLQLPGTPRPVKNDPYDQPPGTPRPVLTDPYSQPPGTPRPGAGPGAGPEAFPRPNPRANLMPHQTDPFANKAQSRIQDTFACPSAPGSQTPKHPGNLDEGFSLPQTNSNQTPVHAPFEQAPLTTCLQTGERLSHDVSTNTSTLNSHITMQPPLGDAEEKIKQRQRLRQLIIKQQQQKSAIRQEKGLQEATASSASGTPQHWEQDDSGPQNDMFGRPPPPYPGTMRSPMQAGQRFPGTYLGDQRGPLSDEPQCPRPPFPMDMNNMGMRLQRQRFGFPSGAPSQEQFLRPPHQIQGGQLVDNVPPHMRRSLSVDLVRSMGGNYQIGLPQHFQPRGLPMQQHSIMGQPFIELRHRAQENRVRLPFFPPNALDHTQRPPHGFMGGQNMAFTGNQGPRMMDPRLGQSQQGSVSHLQTSSNMESLHHLTNSLVNTAPQQITLATPLSHPISGDSVAPTQPVVLPVTASGPTEEIPLPCVDGIEEKLDTDDSAVKDLDDVEVKDLVDEDLDNLNLDADDGKDLDLETNDLHLDDLLESGKFDLIAYADPEMNLEDKKDMFNEELDLSDPIEDDHGETSDLQKALSEKQNARCEGMSSAQPKEEVEQGPSNVKLENSPSKEALDNHHTERTIKTEGHHGLVDNQEHSLFSSKDDQDNVSGLFEESCTGVHPGTAPVLPSLLYKEKLEDTRTGSIVSCLPGDPTAQTNLVPGVQLNMGMVMLKGQPQDHGLNPVVTMGHRNDPSLTQEALLGNPNMMQSGNQQVPLQGFGTSQGQQVDLNLPMVGGQQPVPHPINPQIQQGMFTPGPAGQQESQVQPTQQNRPLLLDEQPLLLQDLLDQERQEQQQQRQMQAMIRQRSSDPFFPNIDADAITDPIVKAKMVALKGINKVMVQNSMGMTPMVMNRIQQMPGTHGPDAAGFSKHLFGPDGKMPPQITKPNPPNFARGSDNDSQRKQYEEWLQETQQLLQMQQKFLEDQIGAHRKSKKALSAKQRTAKKAGRAFPEEDAEQLKHVTEQQNVVQKQLEQIRKQQKEHAELIEEYRVKQLQQQQCLQPGVMGPMQDMPGMQGQAPGMMSGGPPMSQPVMGPIMPMQQPHFGQPKLPCMPKIPGWHPGASGPMGPRMPPHMTPQMPIPNPAQPLQAQPPMVPGGKPGQPGTVAGGNGTGAISGAPHVKFDDNNPFSEGFQERERRERLREQQEKQRVQLMQEVERQRALQRLELEQRGLGIGPDNSGDGLAQMPFFNADLSQEFIQMPRTQRQQQQMGQMFPQQGNMPLDFAGPGPGFMQGGKHRPMPGNGSSGPDMVLNFQPKNPMMHAFPQGQPQPHGFGGAGMPPKGGASSFGMDSTTPLPPNYPGSGQSLIQLYSNIIPEEKGKKKRNRKKKKEDDADSVKTPSTPHSDLNAPLTPCVSDTSSTPTRSVAILGDQDTSEFSNPLGSVPGLQPSSELENQISGGTPLRRQSSVGSEAERGLLHEIKLEKLEASDCQKAEGEAALGHGAGGGGIVKMEEVHEVISPSPTSQSPAQGNKGETGNELLKHLLKNKSTPPPSSTPLTHQMTNDSIRSEDEGLVNSKCSERLGNIDSLSGINGQLTVKADLESSLPEQCKRKQHNKRTPKSGNEKAPSRWKKRKKEDEERQALYTSTDTLMTQLKQQLSMLPLLEPVIRVNFAHFPPYGSRQLDGENRLSGSFGSASLDGVSDYYSQLIYKNNLSNPPTPPASLPPTPPPLARQKLLNGFASTEELARKAEVMGEHEVSKSLGQKPLTTPFKGKDDLLGPITHGPKTVDVPASLPTPPHNNQEELRGQEHCVDRDTPDSFVLSSSPESVVGMEISRYPDLYRVKEERPSPAVSPVIPMLPSASGKGSEAKLWEVKMEPPSNFFGSQFRQLPTCSRTDLVSVDITLNPVAAQNIQGVVSALANMLCMSIPGSYEVIRSPGPEHRSSIEMLTGLKVPPQTALFHQQPGMRLIRPPGAPIPHQTFSKGSVVIRPDYQMGGRSPGFKPQWCSHCKVVVLGNGFRKSIKDLPINKQGHGGAEGSLVFCSHNCFVLYSATMQTKSVDGKPNMSFMSDSEDKHSPAKVLHKYSNNISDLDVHCLAQLHPKLSPSPTPPISFPSITSESFRGDAKSEALKVTVKLKPRPRAVHNSGDNPGHWSGKRWKAVRWRKWSIQIVVPKGNYHLPVEEEVDELLKKLGTSLRPEPMPKDSRRCCFCHEEGDGLTDGPARLLNLDLDLWVHLNCALWSTEVYETQAGALINVELALRRGLSVHCVYCQQTGATSGCHRLRCTNAYHFTCALKAQCTFFKDKTMLCHVHRPRGTGLFGGGLAGTEHELHCFAVFRRVYVQRDEARQIARIIQRGERKHTFRVGSLVFHSVGQLLPQQMQAFHSTTAIFPVGYEASRIYWSMRHGNRRCHYVCSIDEKDGEPEFIIRIMEQGYDDLVLTGASPKGVWDKVLEPVAERRNETGLLKLFPIYLKGEDLFGLTVSAVTRIVESLPGVDACERYTFRYGCNPLMQLPLAINPSGCARSEPKTCTHVKRPHTLTSSSFKALQSPGNPVEMGVALYSKQFVHSKSSQYRRMNAEWKSNVYLARSRIQGLGLYAARDIEKYTMVIEYIGTIIRNEVANRKEKMYEAQNRGVYMFRIDSEHVIDATITGGPARYINHSCAPNCIAEVVTFERGHKIIISSNRRIQRGEELCYDYKFDLEDDQHKIPCHCGAVNCRKWMN
ncbi:histone-lysine N-methyltransferase 2C-like isoform X2 [Myxocyprinus asiaticus]|uniref:histone-lysine N-methyltransferase 2C-like isoform X2 n=1 Tax=Myxocyprinus asiaticus TaxID=70543 RepID=UPI002221F358|nr:histone-lysine N-methyltransferase 2C-like isoform X2 [Myxocyprinus asiaticus]